MTTDAKLGLALGVGLVILVAAMFFRNVPVATTGTAAAMVAGSATSPAANPASPRPGNATSTSRVTEHAQRADNLQSGHATAGRDDREQR